MEKDIRGEVRAAGSLTAMEPKRCGRRSPPVNPLARKNDRLRRKNEQLTARLRQAETIIGVQTLEKVSAILGRTATPIDAQSNASDSAARHSQRATTAGRCARQHQSHRSA